MHSQSTLPIITTWLHTPRDISTQKQEANRAHRWWPSFRRCTPKFRRNQAIRDLLRQCLNAIVVKSHLIRPLCRWQTNTTSWRWVFFEIASTIIKQWATEYTLLIPLPLLTYDWRMDCSCIFDFFKFFYLLHLPLKIGGHAFIATGAKSTWSLQPLRLGILALRLVPQVYSASSRCALRFCWNKSSSRLLWSAFSWYWWSTEAI